MSSLTRIVLPPGTSIVNVSDIPALIAEAIYPSTDSTAMVVSGLDKQMLAPDGTPLPGLFPLTSDPLHDFNTPESLLLEAIYITPGETPPPMTDWAWLNLAWLYLPALKLPLAEAEWPKYAEALQAAMQDNHDWMVVPQWTSLASATYMLRMRAQTAHRGELARALTSEVLKPHSTTTRASLVPGVGEDSRGGAVTVAQLTEYVSSFHIEVVLEPEEVCGDLQITATVLLGSLTAQILRSMLAAMPGEIRHEYGVTPDQARVSLRCCDLAELLH